MDPMPDADDAAEPFEIDVEQIADPRPLITLHRPARFDQGHPIEPGARQHAGDGRARTPSAVLICQAVARARRNATIAASAVTLVRRGWRWGRDRPIREGRPITGEPLRDGPDAHAERLGRLPLRQALMPYATGEQSTLIHVGLRITMNSSFGRASRNGGLV